MNAAKDWMSRLDEIVWGPQEGTGPALQPRGLRIVRTVLVLGRDLALGQITLRAMGLVYTTLLSIVPLLALSFSVLKAFGVYNQIQPMLLNFLSPLGEKGEEIASSIVGFIHNMNVGVLGALGLGMLLYTAVSLMQKIEESLNFIWHVTRPRALGERFSRYLTVLMVGPILVFSALGLTASVMNFEAVRGLLAIGVLGESVEILSRMVPYVLVSAAFTFVYMFIPNTRIRFIPALAGGAVGGFAWQSAGWAFATFVASSNTYSAVYSSLAVLILFMIWLYLNWLILLFGASVAFYIQRPEYLYAKSGEPRLSNRMRERLGLSVMSLVAGRFLAGKTMPALQELSGLLGVPVHTLQVVLDALERQELVVQSGGDPPVYLPSRDLEQISVKQVLEVVRGAGEDRFLSPEHLPAPQPVEAVLDRMRLAIESSVSDLTLRELAALETEAATQGPATPTAIPGSNE
ncbi:MAG: YihY family inner membrane protein [Sulfuritalea sp.]|nr:YihY family inner membrane protein [Sulfuritalea sp.]